LQLTQAFAAKVGVADIADSRRAAGGSSSAVISMGSTGGRDHHADKNEFAREQASLRDRMHAKKASMVVLNSSAKMRRGKSGGRGTKVKVMFDESSTTTTDHRQISNRTTTNALQFAPPSFSLTKSTRQLLEETVLGLGGFGVSEKTTLSSFTTTTTTQPSNSNVTAPYSGSSFPASSAWSVIPRPPPNTPIVHKNPYARLSQDDDDDDNDRPAASAGAAVVPRLTFQPARFEPAVGTMMMMDHSYVDPDL
jgi:hypothetical protein